MTRQSFRRAVLIDRHDPDSHTDLIRQHLEKTSTPVFIEELTVAPNYDGWRIDKYLCAVIPRTSRTQAQRYLKTNVELIPPRPLKASCRLHSGDVVRIVRHERVPPGVPTHHDMEILAEGEQWAVINKPAGILVHRNSREVSHTVDAYLQRIFPDHGRVEATHRLDRDTSGCMLVGFGRAAVSHWRSSFQRREVHKTYIAIVHDPNTVWPTTRETLLDTPLGVDPTSELPLKMGRGDAPSRTHVRVRARDGVRALLELRPIEGRQHQLRAHLALENTPIVGDKLYAMGDAYFMRYCADPALTMRTIPPETPYHCLHAEQISIPIEGVMRTVHAPVPPHFYIAMPALRDTNEP